MKSIWGVYRKCVKCLGCMRSEWEGCQVFGKYGKCLGSVWKGLEVYEKYGKNQKCMLSYWNYGKCIQSMGSVWGCN